MRRDAAAKHLQPHITRLSGDVLRASLLRCSRNKLSGTGELLNLGQLSIRVLVLLVFGTKPNSIKTISGSAVMWWLGFSSPLFGETYGGRREFAVPLTNSDFVETLRRDADRRNLHSLLIKACFQPGVSGVAFIFGTVRRLKAKVPQPLFGVP